MTTRWRRVLQRRNRRLGRGPIIGAIGVFLVICGFVLVVWGGDDEEEAVAEQPTAQTPVDDEAFVRTAIRDAEAAEAAIDDRNYSEAKRLIQQTQRRLVAALGDDDGGGTSP